MTRQVIRFRVSASGLRVAEVDRFRIQIEVCLGPDSLPIEARELGYRAQAFAAGSAVSIWEDWRATLGEAKCAAAEWLATRLGARSWGLA